MKTILRSICLGLVLICFGCDDDALMPGIESISYGETSLTKNSEKSLKTTGEVEVTYIANPGGHNDMDQGNATSEGKTRFATVVFNAHEPSKNQDAKGSIDITIKNEKGEVKRMFKAEVHQALVFPNEMEARFLATVYSDERMDGGHSGDHTDTGDDHAGGPAGNGGYGSGGPGTGGHDDGTHDDGTHDDGTHDDGDHGGGCNSGDEEHGNKSRVGQVIGVKVYDGGSPGTNGDTMHWKWYGGHNPNEPSVEGPQGWGEMCEKTIISGNLVVHAK